MTAGHTAARSHEVPLQRVLWFSASLLGGDVSFAICKVPCTGPEAEGRVGRGSPGGEGHPRRVQLRRVGIVQPQGDGDGVHLVPEGDGAEHCHSPAAAPGLRAPRRVVEDPIVLGEPGERGDGRSHRVATPNRGSRADRWSGAR